MKAAHALVVKEKGSAKRLSIGNLLTLIKWAGGQVITDPPLDPTPTLSKNLTPKPNIQQHTGDYLANACITCLADRHLSVRRRRIGVASWRPGSS